MKIKNLKIQFHTSSNPFERNLFSAAKKAFGN